MRSALAIAALLAGIARADEAVVRDGRRVEGSLSLTAEKVWQFVPSTRSGAVPLSSIHHVRFTDADAPPLRAGLVQRVALRDGTVLTGILLGLDAKQLDLRTVWAEKLSVPRSAVASFRPLPGWSPVLLDDFREAGPRKVIGENGTTHDPRAGTLVLNAKAGIEYALPRPVEAGRVGINFDPNDAEGGIWFAEAEFRTPEGPRVVTVSLAGADHEARVPGLEGTATKIARAPGWRRLDIRFSPTALRVSLDGASVWHNLEKGPGGGLVRFRIIGRVDSGKVARGGCKVAEFAVFREDDEPRRPAGDPSQDEIWLRDGDQLFGRIVGSDSRSIRLEGSFGSRSFRWADVRGLFLTGDKPHRQNGERIRLWIDGGAGGEPDVVEGVIVGWDEKLCRLRHPDLGELSLDRSRVRRLSWEPSAAKE